MLRTAIATIALALASAASSASAATLFSGNLTGAQETVPNATSATGFGLAKLSDDMNTLSVRLSWNGLVAPAAAGHIHCCAFPGANAPVAVNLSPEPVITGSVFNTFDLTNIATYGGGFLAANGGTAASARAALLSGLTAGSAYFNIHNAPFPAGQIRGQISAAVPEPASWAMMIGGFGLVGAAMRRRLPVEA